MNGLAGRKGGVVAIEPQTGKVRVMVSIPEYDPNRIPTDFQALDTDPNKPTSTAPRRSSIRRGRRSRW